MRLWLLGRFTIEVDGATLAPPRGRHARSLLAWLALNPGVHSRSRVAARFWPEVLDASARASLRVALSELRAALGEAADCLVADRNQVGLAQDRVWVDALAFAELERRGELGAAGEICHGELLPDLDEDWVLEARDAHNADLVDVLARLASEREAAGDLVNAISLSRRMVAIDPLGEETARGLMRRLTAAGERGAAIAVYRRLAERLQNELRMAPAPATRALAEDLRREESPLSESTEPEDATTSFELAVSHYRQALERAEATNAGDARRGELLIGLGTALAHAGRSREAASAFDDAARLAKITGDPQLLARAALGAAGLGVTILDLDEALAGRLADALNALPEADSPLRAEALARLAIARAYSPDRLEAGQIAEQAVQMARRLAEPRTLARALCALHVGLGAPERLEERLASASEMLGLAQGAGDREGALQARNFRVSDLLEAGNVAGFDRELEAYAAQCREFPLPVFRWYVPLWRATRATFDGDLDTAARLAARAREQGRQAGDANAELFWRLQAGTLMLAQRRFSEIDTTWAEDHARNSPAGTAWLTILSWIWAEQGRLTDARALLGRLAEHDFASLEQDTNWMSGIAELIQATVCLGDARRASLLYQQLAPFGGRIVTAARSAQVYGPVDLFLGRAALTAGEPETSRRHLTAALELSEACGAHLWADAARRCLTGDAIAATTPSRDH